MIFSREASQIIWPLFIYLYIAKPNTAIGQRLEGGL